MARPDKQPRRLGKKKLNERGVALIIVVISITVLTVMATEFAYNSRVDLQLAANARDEIRAYYFARSGIGLSRLIIRFQKQLDTIQLPPGISELLSGGLPGAAGGAPAAGAPKLRIFDKAPISSSFLASIIVDEKAVDQSGRPAKGARKKFDFDTENPELAAAQEGLKFAQLKNEEEGFLARITNENERINVARLDQHCGAVLPQLTTLIADKRFEFLYERPDSNNVQATPGEIILALRDWADEDEVQSSLNPNSPIDPFVKGFSDENYHYDRFDPRYKAKNGRYDSLDELFLVHGVNDHFMAAFRDYLTVYPDPNEGLDVNSNDPLIMAVAIIAAADPNRPDPRLRDPIFLDTIIEKIRATKVFMPLGISVQAFVGIVQAAGVAVKPDILRNAQNKRDLTDTASTFRITSVGRAGQVEKTITTVVQADNALGKLLYWREE